VNSRSRIKVNFKTDVYQSTFSGVLLYHLQRKENDKYDNRSNTDKDTSMSTQLLVIWEFRIDRLYSHAWLIEHKSTLIWNEDMLRRLYGIYDSQRDTIISFNTGKWLLNDNTKLQIMCEASYESGFEMKIIISEEKDMSKPQKPLWIDSNR
jgi:hypothetical protein